jgi:hypothetical protein
MDFRYTGVGRIKIKLNLWSVFLQISRIFLQSFPVTLLRSSTQTKERQSLHNVFTKTFNEYT